MTTASDMKYTVNNLTLQYTARGPLCRGIDHVLLRDGDDLTAQTSWRERGYNIEPLFDEGTQQQFHLQAAELLRRLWEKAGLSGGHEFSLEHYHRLAHTQQMHLAAVEQTKLINVAEFPIAISILEERIAESCKQKLKAQNPWDGSSSFHFRVIRPQQADNNPLHRDVWLEDYDNCINLYIPIAGSNERSSLIIYPGSHLWPESMIERTEKGAVINGVRFNVPAVASIDGNPTPVRPNPSTREVLIFSPYLIHGGSVNLNEDVTRISIEIRLWKA